MEASTNDEIINEFRLARSESDPVKKYRHVELLIFLIKLKGGLEVPFEKAYGGDLERAERLYVTGNYVEAVKELRKVKADILRSAKAGQRQEPEARPSRS